MNTWTLINKRKKYRLGIALGGGGARGFAHLGVMKALEEKGIRPDVISGTSAGALAGAFLAAGNSPEKAMKLIGENKILDYVKLKVPNKGLLGLGKMEKLLIEKLPCERIEDLEKPMFITVTNLNNGSPEYISAGPLIPYILASVSIPIIFSPMSIKGNEYVDGGLMDNLPVAPLVSCCDKIIGVSISPIEKMEKTESLIGVATRTFQLSVNNNRNNALKKCHVFIQPDGLEEFGLMDMSSSYKLFELGYDHVRKMSIEI
jgi:NTE family protein